MVHGVCWTEITDMQLAYGAATGSSRQSSLLYGIGISSVTFPVANNNAILLIYCVRPYNTEKCLLYNTKLKRYNCTNT